MAKTKRFFISDLHLSSQALYDDPKKPAWYDPAIHNPRLFGFLDKTVLAQKDQVKDLILLGDVFNTWVCPAKKNPPKYSEIFAANREVLNKFKEIIKAGIDIYYVNGNHDYDLDAVTLQKAIPGIKAINYYRTGRIYAEHGSQYDIYNKPDYVTDPAFGRPIGYFISRLVSTIGSDGFGLIDLADYLDDILEAALTPQNIFASIIEGLAERANLKETDGIVLPGQKKISIQALKERFQKLSEVYSINELISDLYQRRYLNGPADRLCKRYEFQVVVFGHTHNAMLDKDWFLTADRIYANSGCWCKPNAHSVEVDKSQDTKKQKTRVRLHKVNLKGESSVIADEEIG